MIKRLEDEIGYAFKDKMLITHALTHSSYGDGRRKTSNNERLEFLGDRVLGLLTAEKLYEVVDGDEGVMARRLNALVRKETCAKVARAIGLGDFLLMSPSEIKQGGRDKISILGDACESLLAAIYLDGGYAASKFFYSKYWSDDITHVTSVNIKDPKTVLQEKASAYKHGLPNYEVVKRSGPDHRPLFVIQVSIDGVGSAQGAGKSKKEAERFAATDLLSNWPKI